MKAINWTQDERTVSSDRTANTLTYSAERVIVGHCPDCNAVLVVFNDHEVWPLVGCACGWTGATDAVAGYMRRTRADA